MFREKAVNLNEAIDMMKASEVAAQHIKEIDQGHLRKWYTSTSRRRRTEVQ